MSGTADLPRSDAESSSEYDLFCRGRLADPYPLLHRLRKQAPVHWCAPLDCWFVTRYDDVLAGHADPRLSSDKMQVKMKQLPPALRKKVERLGQHLSMWVSHTDPPDHTRLRRLVHLAFTPAVVAGMRPRIQEIVDALVDKAETQGQMDIIADFAYPLPVTVVCELLGIPPQDVTQFTQWVEDIVAFIDGSELEIPNVAERSLRSLLELTDYFHAIAQERQRSPGDDMISALVAVEEEGNRLSPDELFAMCVQMLVGGHDTTTGLIGNGLHALLQNPAELEKLKANPSLIDSAVEEFLRYESPGPRDTRLALEDLEIGGQQVREGQAVVLMLSAANRDPEQFPDPDRLDICRQPNKHVAFGWGIHFCLGAPLARLMGEIALNTLLRRLPEVRFADNSWHDNPPWREAVGLRMLNSLPVVY